MPVDPPVLESVKSCRDTQGWVGYQGMLFVTLFQNCEAGSGRGGERVSDASGGQSVGAGGGWFTSNNELQLSPSCSHGIKQDTQEKAV